MLGCGSPNVDDPETLNKIIAEAIDDDKLQWEGKEGKKDGLSTAWYENGQTPYTGWSKEMYEDGQIKSLVQFKDGKKDGLSTAWYENGQKKREINWKDGKYDGLETGWYRNGQKVGEGNYKDGKLMSAVIWKPNGDKCPVTNLKDGNGVMVLYDIDGKEIFRTTFKDGERVKD